MLTFLRRIRKGLLGKGATSKYVIYALGEVLLVMVGILLALQVNNWNEGKKEERLEYVTLSELKKNIEANIQEIDYTHGMVDIRIKSIRAILNAFSEKHPFSDSLIQHFGWAMVYDRVNLHVGAYNSYIASGSQVVKDEKLRFEISKYFDNTLRDLEGYMIELRDDFYSYMLGYLRNEFKSYNNFDHLGVPRDYYELSKNESFEISLGIFLDVQLDALRSLVETREKSNMILDNINHRLTNLGLNK